MTTRNDLSAIIDEFSGIHDRVGDLPGDEPEIDDAYSEMDAALRHLLRLRRTLFPLEQPVEMLDKDNQHDFEVCWRGTLGQLLEKDTYPNDILVRLKDPDIEYVDICAGQIRVQKT